MTYATGEKVWAWIRENSRWSPVEILYKWKGDSYCAKRKNGDRDTFLDEEIRPTRPQQIRKRNSPI